MRSTRIIAIAALILLALLAPATARVTKTLPAAVILRDSYEGFTATFVSARHGKFDVSIGESHEGDPGFDGNQIGAPFQVQIAIYHLEPERSGLPYVSTYVLVAEGRQGKSITPSFRGTRKVVYKGITFLITPKNLTWTYGAGKTSIEVRALEP